MTESVARRAAIGAVILSGPPLMALTFSAIAPVLPAIAHQFSSGSGGGVFAQWVMTAPALGLMLGGIVGGILVDRIGPRDLMAVALGLFAVAGSAGLYLADPFLLLFSRFLLGLSGSCAAMVATWLIGARCDEIGRRRILGAQDALAGAAALCAVLLSGIAMGHGGWRLPFAFYLIAAPLVPTALFAIRRDVPRAVRRSSPAARDLLRLWPIYVSVVAMSGLMMMPATQVPFLLERHAISDPIARSRIIACSSAAAIIASAWYGPVRRWAGLSGTLLVVILAYACGTAFLGVSSGVSGFAIGCVMLGIGTGIFSPYFANVLIARTSAPERGRALGLLFSAIFLGEFLSPLLLMMLRQIFGFQSALVAIAGGLFIASAVVAGSTYRGARLRGRVTPGEPANHNVE